MTLKHPWGFGELDEERERWPWKPSAQTLEAMARAFLWDQPEPAFDNREDWLRYWAKAHCDALAAYQAMPALRKLWRKP